MATERTPEQIEADRDRMAKVRAARQTRATREMAKPSAQSVAVAEEQCEYCSLYFAPHVLVAHQQKVHKGELIREELLPRPTNSQLHPGSITRSGGIPMKIPWTRRWIEEGWQCSNSDCRDPARSGWAAVPPQDTIPNCGICGQPMHKLFQMIDWDAPPNAPHMVTYQGVSYRIEAGEVNRVPDVIAGIARDSMRAGRPTPLMDTGGDSGSGRLRTVGLMPPIGEEEEAERIA